MASPAMKKRRKHRGPALWFNNRNTPSDPHLLTLPGESVSDYLKRGGKIHRFDVIGQPVAEAPCAAR